MTDDMGRRVEKKVYSGTTGNGQLTTDTTKSYTWGLDFSQTTHGAGPHSGFSNVAAPLGGLLCVIGHNDLSAIAYYATADANGDVSEYLDSTGASVAHYEYSPFGRTTVATRSHSDIFKHRFSTKYLDVSDPEGSGETGLYYYGARSYSPALGRWK